MTPHHLYLIGLAIELLAAIRGAQYYRVNPRG